MNIKHAINSIAFGFCTLLAICPLIVFAQNAIQPIIPNLSRQHILPKTPEDVKNLVDEMHKTPAEDRSDTKQSIYLDLINVPSDAASLRMTYRKLLDDKDEVVRMAAIQVAVKMGMKETIPKIRELYKKQTRPTSKMIWAVRGGPFTRVDMDMAFTTDMAEALIDLGDFESAEDIIRNEAFMESTGGISLAKFGAPVLPLLIQNAYDGKNWRRGIGGAISYMRDEAAVPLLIELLNGKDPKFADASGHALVGIVANAKSLETKRLIGDQFERAVLNNNGEVRTEAYIGLLVIDPDKNGKRVFDAIKKENGFVQLNVLCAISTYRIKGLGSYLEDYMKYDEVKNPNDNGHRKYAAAAIYRTTGKKVHYDGLEKDQKWPDTDPYAPK